MTEYVQHKENKKVYGFLYPLLDKHAFTQTLWVDVNNGKSLPKICREEDRRTKEVDDVEKFLLAFNVISKADYNELWAKDMEGKLI
jgi:hypothetical protein